MKRLSRRRKTGKRILAASFSVCFASAALAATCKTTEVRAEELWEKNGDNTAVGTGVITNPSKPEDRYSEWSGNYIYFGTYDSTDDGIDNPVPVKYRVLDTSTTRFSADKTTKTIFLDCDSVLYSAKFLMQWDGSHGLNDWTYSDINKNLNNGDASFYATSFSPLEQKAITESVIASHPLAKDGDENVSAEVGCYVDEKTQSYYSDYVELTGEKVFLLDMEDLSNNSYGYATDNNARSRTKKKGGENAYWWSRSAGTVRDDHTGVVNRTGGFDNQYVRYESGVSPAFNINPSSVLFSTLIRSDQSSDPGFGEPGAVYKLTLLDNEMSIEVPNEGLVSINRNTVTVPYTVSGKNAGSINRVSVLLLNKEYVQGEVISAGTNDAGIPNYTYLKLDTGSGDFSKSGSGTFVLPEVYTNKKCNKDYYMYILAEDENGIYETDYASSPVSISPVSAVYLMKISDHPEDAKLTYDYESGSSLSVSISIPSDIDISYQWFENDKKSNIGGKAIDGATSASYTIPTGFEVGKRYYYCEVTATEEHGTATIGSDVSVVTINKKPVTVSGITAENKTYDGSLEATLKLDTVSFKGLKDGDSLTVTASGKFSDANAGTKKTVNISGFKLGGTSAANYKIADTGNQETTTATISKAKNNAVTVDISGWTYGSTAKQPSSTADFGVDTIKYKYSSSETGSFKATVPTKAGTWYVKAVVPGTDNYVSGESDVKSFEIKKKNLSIKADAKSKDYGDKDPVLTYTCSGLVSGDKITGTLSREPGEAPGTYAILQNTLSAGANYNISYKGANLKIVCRHKSQELRNYKQETCTAAGYTGDTYCKDCGKKLKTGTKVAATGHSYGKPVWTWTGTTKAVARFTCKNDSSHVKSVKANITSRVTTPATCTTKGVRTYTATVEFNGKTYTAKKTESIAAKGHSWGTPKWTWTGTTKAVAAFTCKTDSSHTKKVAGKITNKVTTKATVTAAGTKTYTATVTLNGKTYKATKTEKIYLFDKSFTGIKKYNNVLYYVKNGIQYTSFTGFAKYGSDWYYVEKGKVDTTKKDVLKGTVNGESGWWFISGGKVQFIDSVEKNSSGWWCIQKGKVNFNFTGIAKNSNGSWYCKGGQVQLNYSGKITYNGKTYTIKNGKVVN